MSVGWTNVLKDQKTDNAESFVDIIDPVQETKSLVPIDPYTTSHALSKRPIVESVEESNSATIEVCNISNTAEDSDEENHMLVGAIVPDSDEVRRLYI